MFPEGRCPLSTRRAALAQPTAARYFPDVKSLRARLFGIWLLSLAASLAVGVLLVQLYGQSSTALVTAEQGALARACEVISDRYAYYVSDWAGPAPPPGDQPFRRDLASILTIALAGTPMIEGGFWQEDEGLRPCPRTICCASAR